MMDGEFGVAYLLEENNYFSTFLFVLAAAVGTVCLCRTLANVVASRQRGNRREADTFKPVSVNYHFTRQCNYQCGFCFHTAKTSFVLPIEEAKRGLRMLKDGGS